MVIRHYKSLLPVHDLLLALSVFGSSFQEKFLHCFPRGLAEAVSSAIPCILLLALVEDRNDETLASLQSSGIYPDLHNPSEIIMDGHTIALVYPLSSSHIISHQDVLQPDPLPLRIRVDCSGVPHWKNQVW